VIRAHDIGLDLVLDDDGEIGFRVFVGGGLGRTPILGKVLRDFLPRRHLLSYLDAILRLYNRYGRRDNMYKARIKILVQALGIEEFSRQVEAEWAQLKDGPTTVPDAEFTRLAGHFAHPPGTRCRQKTRYTPPGSAPTWPLPTGSGAVCMPTRRRATPPSPCR
jgi:sulfite reductase (NADPH) hemoprotein beta-component